MTFKEGMIHARSYLVFLAGLLFCMVLVIVLESQDPSSGVHAGFWHETSTGITSPAPTELTPQETQWARIAWQYFENNYQPRTGLANSADKYPATTMWDTGSYLMALISANRLHIITENTFNERLSLALTSLSRLPLFEDTLPNKSYNALSLEMVDYNNNKTARGIGWSAIDIGRLLVPFNIIAWHYPEHTRELQQAMGRWRFDKMLRQGQLYGAALDDAGKTVYVQEGRLGYEQYSAKSFSLIGLDVTTAMNYRNFLKYVSINSIQIPVDARNPERYHAHNYVVSESYILDGLEYGWDVVSHEFAYRVYRAQEERFRQTQVLTAVSEDNLDQPPFFVYNTVYTNGKPWNAITEKGEDASKFKSLSTKAVFGWDALYSSDYTNRLVRKIASLCDPQRGWYAGLYEVSGQPNRALTANTNAIVLESLCFKKSGQLVTIGAPERLLTTH